MAGGGKGGKQTTEVKLPGPLDKAARENLALADRVGRLGYIPFEGPVVAGVTQPQYDAMANTAAAASAFGLPSAPNPNAAQLPALDPSGMGYSAMPLYERAIAMIDPAHQKALDAIMARKPEPRAAAAPRQPATTNAKK